jgi:5-formyltetrahydrofolate cyclo-ligase
MDTNDEQKAKLRATIKEQRKEIDHSTSFEWSTAIKKHLIELSENLDKTDLFLFMKAGNEPDIRVHPGHPYNLYAPCVIDKSAGTMDFYQIRDFDELKVGSFNIPEPDPDIQIMAKPSENTVIFCPCLAVDKKGTRLGYGGGYYDRYLADYPDLPRVAVCFDQFFIDQEIPRQSFDVSMDFVITEKGITKI